MTESEMLISSSSSRTTGHMVDDPLLKDLSERKQNFRRNVVSLAAELKDIRRRIASQEHCLAKESISRQEAETKAKKMEKEISRLEKILAERNVQLQASTSAAHMYVKELDDLRFQLSATKAIADASALSAQSAQLQCSTLVKELEDKNLSLKEQEICVNKLGEQLDVLQTDLRTREFSQIQLKCDVSRIEHETMQALTKAGANRDYQLRNIVDEVVSPKKFEKIYKLLSVKDDEIAKLRDDITSAHWKLKTKELESQLEKHRRTDQELKMKVLKLEFCLQDARAQTRKLQRMGERRDIDLKELRDQLAAKQQSVSENKNFWETSGFKIVGSMSMLILVMISKR